MAQDLLYSVLPRPALGAENLVYRRRVAATTKASKSREIGKKEQKEPKYKAIDNSDKEKDFNEELIDEITSNKANLADVYVIGSRIDEDA